MNTVYIPGGGFIKGGGRGGIGRGGPGSLWGMTTIPIGMGGGYIGWEMMLK